MSADFRLRDAEVYNEWYGRTHDALDLLADAVYGLTDIIARKSPQRAWWRARVAIRPRH